MEHTVHKMGEEDILSMNEIIVVEVFDGEHNLTSGMSFVWMQSMGLPTYCLAETIREKANIHVVVTE